MIRYQGLIQKIYLIDILTSSNDINFEPLKIYLSYQFFLTCSSELSWERESTVYTTKFETSLQNQHTNDYGASVGGHALASSIPDQITSHHGNTDINESYYSQSFETHKKIIAFLSVLAIQSQQQPYQIH